MRSNTVMPLLRNDQFYCSALRAVVTLVVMADVMDVLWHNSDSSKVRQQLTTCRISRYSAFAVLRKDINLVAIPLQLMLACAVSLLSTVGMRY